MTRVRQFGQFWYDFVIGDDWRLAGGAAIALGLVGLGAHTSVSVWWVAPLILGTLLGVSVLRAKPRGS